MFPARSPDPVVVPAWKVKAIAKLKAAALKAKGTDANPVPSAATLTEANDKQAAANHPAIDALNAADNLSAEQAANLKQKTKIRDHQAKLLDIIKGEADPAALKRPSYVTIYNRKKKLPALPTEGLLQGVCFLIQEGAVPKQACIDLGVTARVWHKWIELAEKDEDSDFALFFTCLAMADARDENDDLQLITRGAKHSGALQWKRERKTGARWGAKVTHAIGGVEGAPITVQAEATLTVNSGARILAMLHQAGAVGKEQKEDEEVAGLGLPIRSQRVEE
jgi:hypothetical protein